MKMALVRLSRYCFGVALLAISTLVVQGSCQASDTRGGRAGRITAVNPSHPPKSPIDPTPLRRFVFASCSRAHLPQPWRAIRDVEPQLFVWLGDTVYADRRVLLGYFTPRPLEEMARKYDELLQHKGYSELME